MLEVNYMAAVQCLHMLGEHEYQRQVKASPIQKYLCFCKNFYNTFEFFCGINMAQVSKLSKVTMTQH